MNHIEMVSAALAERSRTSQDLRHALGLTHEQVHAALAHLDALGTAWMRCRKSATGCNVVRWEAA